MYKNMCIGDALVEVDMVATQKWYASANAWDCSCGDCRRFLRLALDKKIPDSTVNILKVFGISPEKATYVCLVDGADLYEYCYRIKGKIIEKNIVNLDSHCTCEAEHPCPSFEFPSSHFDIVFYENLPVVVE